jgi:hypothetical protein
MKILRKIINKALRDRARTEDIRKTCKVDNVVKAVRGKKKCNNHIERMTDNRVVKIARDKLPKGRRSTGKPGKR